MTNNKNEPNGVNASPRPSRGGIHGFLKEKEVCERASLARARLWRKVKEGTFPAPVKLSNGRVAWYELEVTEWILNPIV